MKKSPFIIITILIIIILAAACLNFGLKANQYKKVIDYHFPMSEEMLSVMGKVTNIQDKIISIETVAKDFYKLPEDWKTKIIKVTITDQTKITKSDFETGESIEINLSEIKIEDRVSARAGGDIKNKSEFTANYFEIFSIPEETE